MSATAVDDETLGIMLAPNASPISKAMTVLCGYYREFLSTDFKKVQTPKRKYAMRDSKSNRMGVRIDRFGQFRSVVAGKLGQRSASNSIKHAQYRVDLSKSVKAGIGSAIDRVDTEGLGSSSLVIPDELISRHKASKNLDQATLDARRALEAGLQREVVGPLIDILEPVFGDITEGTDTSTERQLSGYAEEIVALLLDE
jgi:hypothetical protein